MGMSTVLYNDHARCFSDHLTVFTIIQSQAEPTSSQGVHDHGHPDGKYIVRICSLIFACGLLCLLGNVLLDCVRISAPATVNISIVLEVFAAALSQMFLAIFLFMPLDPKDIPQPIILHSLWLLVIASMTLRTLRTQAHLAGRTRPQWPIIVVLSATTACVVVAAICGHTSFNGARWWWYDENSIVLLLVLLPIALGAALSAIMTLLSLRLVPASKERIYDSQRAHQLNKFL